MADRARTETLSTQTTGVSRCRVEGKDKTSPTTETSQMASTAEEMQTEALVVGYGAPLHTPDVPNQQYIDVKNAANKVLRMV